MLFDGAAGIVWMLEDEILEGMFGNILRDREKVYGQCAVITN